MVPIEACAVIILAAGSSRRFGTDNKLLANFRGKPLLSHVMGVVSGLPVAQKLLVTGHDRHAVAGLGEAFGILPIHNDQHLAGMGTSIACGVRNLASGVAAVFIVPGDMPLIAPDDFLKLAALLRTPETICRPQFEDRPGHPVLFARAYFPALARLQGENGAQDVIRAAGHHLATIEQANPDTTYDVDMLSDHDSGA
jgi:molybdenum cofactor cytidylyltransferase